MAANYEQFKNVWSGFNDEQKKKYSEQYKNDATFQQFIGQYNQNGGANNSQGTNPQGGTSTNQNGNSGNGTTGDFSSNNNGKGNMNDPITYREENNQGNDGNGNGTGSYYNRDGYSSDGKNGDGNQYGKTEFDKEEQLDKSMFGDAPGKITVEQGTGKETGRPDYEIDTPERLNEMRANLDEYYATMPQVFRTRDAFNQFFEYNSRASEKQRQLLDSYWKKAEDMRTASNYTTGESITTGMNNAEITPDVFDLIKQQNPEAYAQWQKALQDQNALAIANWSFTGAEPIEDTLMRVINKLGIQPGDPYQIEEIFNQRLDELHVWQDSEQLRVLGNNIAGLMSAMSNNAQSLSSQLEGRYSAGYIDARINKANSNLQSQAQTMLTSYQTLLQGRQQNIALASQSAQVRQMQAQEDQRIFDNKLKSLGFAMQANSYRTPEQEAALDLQKKQISNNMDLLQKSQENDLALYNKYANAKLDNQLNSELTDLSVSDPTQLRANLNNVLSQYYDKFGDIIERPISQAIDDVLAYAKKNGVSVGEAVRQEFTKKLQGKTEYQNYLKSNYAAPENKYQNKWDVSIDKDGNVTTTYSGYGNIPDNISKATLIPGLKNGYEETGSFNSYISSLTALEGKQGLWCGEFVNSVLSGMGDTTGFGNTLQDKIKVTNRAASEGPVYGAAVVLDTGVEIKDDEKGYSYNAGHVGIITGIDNNGVYITDSNWDGSKTVSTHYMTNEQLNKLSRGYYVSPKAAEMRANDNAHSTPMDSVFDKAYKNAKTEGERSATATARTMYESLYKLQNMETSDGDNYLNHFINSSDFEKLVNNMDSSVFGGNDGGSGMATYITQYLKNNNMDQINRVVMGEFERLIEMKLRKESGAAISSSEWASNFQLMLPQAGMDSEYSYAGLKRWDDLILNMLYSTGISSKQYKDLFSDSYIANQLSSTGGSSSNYSSYANTESNTKKDNGNPLLGMSWRAIKGAF